MTRQTVITPAPLRPGSRIAIVSPSGWVKPEFIDKAAAVIEEQGWIPVIFPHAKERAGTFAGTADQRFEDLSRALLDPAIDAIMCSRGGYGAVHLLDRLDSLPLRDNAKWLIGFSDISALHALLSKHGVMSVHGNMTKHLAVHGADTPDAQSLFRILSAEAVPYEFESHSLNRPGTVTAPIYGGNLAVIMGLFATHYDIIRPDTILFIEDIAEPVYKVERQMYQLKMAGVLDRLAGLVVGQFTEYSPDLNEYTMEEMIAHMTAGTSYPIAFNVPIGHVEHNIPIVEGATTTLEVGTQSVSIIQQL